MACSQQAVRQRDAAAGMGKQPSDQDGGCHRTLPYIPLKSRPPELLKLLNLLWHQINMSHLAESKYSGACFQSQT